MAVLIVGLFFEPVLGVEVIRQGLFPIVAYKVVPLFQNAHIGRHFIVTAPTFERKKGVEAFRDHIDDIVEEEVWRGLEFQPIGRNVGHRF